MIILTDVAKELEKMLNGVSTLNPSVNSITKSTSFLFRVATSGFHLDTIADNNARKDFIPVFIDSMGGEYNPVPNLGEVDYNIPITIYYPVRFKDQFYALQDWLVQVFVGQIRVYSSGVSALSNISVAEYGEIQDLDIKAFGDWSEAVYKQRIDIMEPYMSMSFTLYLSNANSNLLYGNIVKAGLVCGSYTDDNILFNEASIQSQSEPAAEQLLGTNETQGLPVNTSYSTGFSCYIKNTDLYRYILEQWCNGNSQTLSFTITYTFTGLSRANPITEHPYIEFSRTCYLQSVNLPISKGELMSITFTFVKKVS